MKQKEEKKITLIYFEAKDNQITLDKWIKVKGKRNE
jgi:hypothetical protein